MIGKKNDEKTNERAMNGHGREKTDDRWEEAKKKKRIEKEGVRRSVRKRRDVVDSVFEYQCNDEVSFNKKKKMIGL